MPPVGWHSTVVQPWQMTTVWAWEKTVVMVKQPGHLTSMKNERGAGTRVYSRSVRGQRPNAKATTYLQLVLAGLRGGVGVEKINGENLKNQIVSTSANE